MLRGTRKGLRFLASMTMGLALFGLIAVAGIAGSLSPSLGNAVYGSWWFAGLLVALAINTGLCCLLRRPGLLRKGRSTNLRGYSVFLIHIAILLITAFSLWASFAFSSSSLQVMEGSSFNLEGQSVTLTSIRVERYEDGSISDWVSEIEVAGRLAELRVNHPLTIGSSRLLEAGIEGEYRVEFKKTSDGDFRALDIPQDSFLPLSADSSLGLVFSPRGQVELRETRAGGLVGGIVYVSLIKDGVAIRSLEAVPGHPLRFDELGVEINIIGSRNGASLIVRRTPGLDLLWASFALLGLAVCGLFLSPKREPLSSSSQGDRL